MRPLDRLKLVVVTGKGGVGKSVVTAALGKLMAARGRHVLLLEIDPRETIHQLLDAPPSGGEVVEVAPRLYLRHLDARAALDDVVRDRLKVTMLVERVLASPIYQHFTEGAPGLKETAVFGTVLRLLRGHRPKGLRQLDMVILDAPATGHGVTLLAAPGLVADVIRTGPIGHLAADIAAFMADPDQTGVVVVTTAEEMPVQEAVELIDVMASRLDRRPDMVVVNALYPAVAKGGDDDLDDDPAVALWRRRRAINDAEQARLAARWSWTTVELPLLPVEPGPALVGALARRLEPQLR